MKNPRTKKYTPRPIAVGGGLTVFARCHARGEEAVPLRGDQLTDLGVAYWLSLGNLRNSDANEANWSCVVCALNIGMALAEADIGAEYQDAITAALDGAFRAKVRSAKSGNFRLDGDALRDIDHALTVHDAQMETATRAQVTEAMNTVHRRIAEGNVYRVQITFQAEPSQKQEALPLATA